MIDTHTHLNFGAFDKDVGEVIKRAESVSLFYGRFGAFEKSFGDGFLCFIN